MHFDPKLFELWRNFSTESSKMHFTCPEGHFDKNNMLTLWNNFRLWARKCRICGGKFAALLSNLQYRLQMGNWKNSFERIFTFFDCFRTSREHFLVFLLYHSRHGGPNWIPQAKRNISIRKNFTRTFLSFPDYARHFLTILWSLLGMLSKLQFTCSKEHFEKGFFFEIFKIVFGLWAIIIQTSGEKFFQRCPNCILRIQRTDFSAKVCHVVFNFGFERRKS